jgi:TatD DNase family protein
VSLIATYSADNPPFVDVHTHRRNTSAGVISVSNFSQKDFENSNFTEGSILASVGLHPWFLTKENFQNDFEKISQFVKNQHIMSIGECGLDKLKGEDLAFQMAVFEAHIRLAETVSKPVVIHCVRSFGEVVAVKKRLKPTVPLIIHGYNKNEKVLAELLRHDFFISIGASILSKKQGNTEGYSFAEMVQKIPLDHLFFETDDAENVEISAIYEAAAEMLNLELNTLKSIVYDNLRNVF